jgi:hypothetical protein
MKRFIIFGVVLALLVPSMAMAATEFSLGGFIKLDTMWDSDNGVGKNMNALPSRNNDPNFKHGRLKFTAQGSRFNFTIKGPDLWGAKTSGFIEMDFDTAEAGTANAAFSASQSYTPRLRHAMFRFNWPTSELLLGQYFSMFCEYYAESAEDGPLQMTGTPTARLAQVRFTQKFMSDWTVAALIGNPNQANLNNTLYGNAAINNGQYAEVPQLQGKVTYAHDFWGKAAYYGKPTPFTIQFVGGWQRNVMRQGFYNTAAALGESQATVGAIYNPDNQYLNPWMAMGSIFIPVIPTQSANLAGTASILTQWWIGQGVEAFGFTGTSGAKFLFNGTTWNGFTNLNYEAKLLNKFGGFVEGQYYFNNQWFVNALYAVSKAFNVSRSRYQIGPINGLGNMEMAYFNGNEPQTIQQISATLWYRPIQAIKFGLQYSYLAANYYQINGTPAGVNQNTSNFGDNHRVEFVGFFYF